MSEWPLVTVIIPSYNHEMFIGEAIGSVVNQDYPNIELIVIDDGSIDNSRDIIRALSRDFGFSYIEQENQGVAKTLNRGVALAKGKYVTFLASDDFYYRNKVSVLVDALKNSPGDTAAVFGDADLIDEKGELIEMIYQGRSSTSFLGLYLAQGKKKRLIDKGYAEYKMLIEGNFIPAMSILCDLEKVRAVGGFPDQYVIEDYPMWLKLSKLFRIRYLDVPVAAYRQHGNNSIVRERVRFIREQLLILNEEFFPSFQRNAIGQYVYRYAKLLFNFLRYGFK